MSKRELHLYEAVDKAGATIAFANTIQAVRRFVNKASGDTYKTTVVPLRPDMLAKFLTDYCGGAG